MKANSILERNIRILKWVYKVCPSYLLLMLVEEAIRMAKVFLNIYMTACVINEIAVGKSEEKIVTLAIGLVVCYMSMSLIQWAIDKVLIVKRRRVENGIKVSMAEKSITMDYQVLENSATQDMVKQIEDGENYSGGLNSYCQYIASIFRCAFVIVYSIFWLTPLFRAELNYDIGLSDTLVSIMNSVWTDLVVIAVFIGIMYYLYIQLKRISKIQNEGFEHGVRSNRKFGYFISYVHDYAKGKSVRIYNMLPMLHKKMAVEKECMTDIWMKQARGIMRVNQQEKLSFTLCQLLGYTYVGLKVLGGAITIGELTLYVGIAVALYQNISETLDIVSWLIMTSQYLSNYVEYLDLPNEKYDGTLPVEKRLDNEYELEFRNVSFHYPNSKEMVLENVNAKIHVGKKMAIVGKNGSGKSTFIKLLCRLYDPTEGEILLNGIDIRKYDYDEYRNLFGVVFQDFQLFSFSVAQNVAAGVEYDADRVWTCLEQAGMKEKVQGWEKGIETVIYKQDDEGVEISGGEAQKLAIARALYRNAPVVILDEPTAALDPIAELEVYEKFDEMIEDKTAIYISHRMSSCRFCKNILVFDGGKIVQMGSHEALLEKEDGLYAQLWGAQASYYQ